MVLPIHHAVNHSRILWARGSVDPMSSSPEPSSDRPADRDVTQWLEAIEAGEAGAEEALAPLVYDELRRIARKLFRNERDGHTLDPTAVVHEAWGRVVGSNGIEWAGRTHFFALGARAMRRVLVEHARARGRDKRGGGRARVSLDLALVGADTGEAAAAGMLELDAALETLSKLDPRQARVVELRFFAGLSVTEVADAIGVSVRSVEADWTMAKAWLRRELDSSTGEARGPS